MALNPVRAGLAAGADDWPWSSVGAHLAGRDDGMVTVAPVLERVGDFAAHLAAAEDAPAVTAIRRSRTTGRPVGAADWIAALEAAEQRDFAAAKRGPKPKADPGEGQAGGRGYFIHRHRNWPMARRRASWSSAARAPRVRMTRPCSRVAKTGLTAE